MAHAGVDRLGVARGRTVAAAVVGRAQVRAALDDLARNAGRRTALAVAVGLAPAARVVRYAAGVGRIRGMPGGYQSAVHSQTLPIMSNRP